MILGSPYERLVAVNGKPLTSAGQAAEKSKLDNEIAERRQESAQKRAQRIAKYEAERKHNHTLIEELAKAFDFKLVGDGKLNAHDVYVLQAKPRPGYQRQIWRRRHSRERRERYGSIRPVFSG